MLLLSRSHLPRRTVLAGIGAALATAAAAQPIGTRIPGRPFGPGNPPPGHADAAAPGAAKFPHIDVHVHLVPSRQLQVGDAVEACLGALDQFRIPKAVIMSPPQPPPGFFDAPDFAAELRRHGNHFAFLGGGGSLNPILHEHADPDSVTGEVEQKFVAMANRIIDDGAAGFGEIAVLHLSLLNRHPFEQVASAHPLLAALAAVADQRKVVIDLHMDPIGMDGTRTPSELKVPPNPPTLAANIGGLERLLADHPGARIVWAHGGSDLTSNQTPALIGKLMDTYPNLFMSLRPLPLQGATNPFGLRFYNLILTASGIAPDWLSLLRKHSDRFVMGSDSFFVSAMVDPNAAPALLGRANQGRLSAAGSLLSALPHDLAAKIATENPQRIYRI
jgi:Amidohydrolase